MNKIKAFISKSRKKIAAVAVAAVSALAMSVAAFAAEESGSGSSALSGAKDQILEQFSGAASDIVPILIGILGAGLGIFVIFVGIKLGKKMFNTVSK